MLTKILLDNDNTTDGSLYLCSPRFSDRLPAWQAGWRLLSASDLDWSLSPYWLTPMLSWWQLRGRDAALFLSVGGCRSPRLERPLGSAVLPHRGVLWNWPIFPPRNRVAWLMKASSQHSTTHTLNDIYSVLSSGKPFSGVLWETENSYRDYFKRLREVPVFPEIIHIYWGSADMFTFLFVERKKSGSHCMFSLVYRLPVIFCKGQIAKKKPNKTRTIHSTKKSSYYHLSHISFKNL